MWISAWLFDLPPCVRTQRGDPDLAHGPRSAPPATTAQVAQPAAWLANSARACRRSKCVRGMARRGARPARARAGGHVAGTAARGGMSACAGAMRAVHACMAPPHREAWTPENPPRRRRAARAICLHAPRAR